MSVSRYEFPRQTGNQAQDMKALFNAMYKMATNLNIDLNTMRKTINPIGIVISTFDGRNPGSYLGGTWESVGRGRVLVGVDPKDKDFSSVGKTGGSKEMQAHIHGIGLSSSGDDAKELGTGVAYGVPYSTGDNGTVKKYTAGTQIAGTGNSDNLQPYITCYMWRRVK